MPPVHHLQGITMVSSLPRVPLSPTSTVSPPAVSFDRLNTDSLANGENTDQKRRPKTNLLIIRPVWILLAGRLYCHSTRNYHHCYSCRTVNTTSNFMPTQQLHTIFLTSFSTMLLWAEFSSMLLINVL